MKRVYKIGCVGLLSDLPLFVAHAKKMFWEEGETVELTAELGWAGIEAKLSGGQLDAANVPALMPLALSLGLGKIVLPMRVLAAMSYEADAITLNPAFADAFRAGSVGPAGPIHIGIEAPYTQANLLFQTWIKQVHANLRTRVTPVPVAISQIFDFLKEGSIQGVCCSEPIGEIAIEAGFGSTVARSRDYFPLHLQSTLAARESFCATEETAAPAIAAAVKRARHFCADPANHSEVVQIFSQYKSSAFASSALPRTLISGLTNLRTLIGFESRDATGLRRGNDPFGVLIKACLALPGVGVSEQEIRSEAKRVFFALHREAASDLRQT